MIGPSDLNETGAKLVYAKRATRGYRYYGVSTTPGGRGLLLLGYSLFKRP